MAEKDYKKQIAAAQAALEQYSAQQREIEKLYEQARKNASDAYDGQKQKLAEEADRKTNQAAVDMLRTERNIDRTLASRGLAFSGENAQTRLDLTLALRNQIDEIESDQREADAALERERNAKLTDLDLKYADQKKDGAEKLASLHADLASGIAARDNALAQSASQSAASNGHAGDKTQSATQGATQGVAQNGSNLEKWLSEHEPSKEKDPILYAFWKSARRYLEKRNASLTKYTDPEVSARDLAKQFVQAAGKNGKIYGYEQQRRLAAMLKEMKKSYRLSEEYERQLMLNLQSLGYSPEYVQRMDSQTERLRKKAAELYEICYRRYLNVYSYAGVGKEEGALLAEKAALFEEFAYLYANSESSEQFEAAVTVLGLSDGLSDFYRQVEEKNKQEDGKKYRLGSDLP